MGYTTEFTGRFELNKPLDPETYAFLIKFNETRRMARNVDPKYGIEGEFYVDGGGDFGQDREDNIIDYNRSPKTQPGLWCNWKPTDDLKGIEWDGVEKFYGYKEWITYLQEKVLNPRGYTLSGTVHYQGEDDEDEGDITLGDQSESVLDSRLPDPSSTAPKKYRKILWKGEEQDGLHPKD